MCARGWSRTDFRIFHARRADYGEERGRAVCGLVESRCSLVFWDDCAEVALRVVGMLRVNKGECRRWRGVFWLDFWVKKIRIGIEALAESFCKMYFIILRNPNVSFATVKIN